MQKKMETSERDATNRSSFKCTGCNKNFTDLEADQLLDMYTGELKWEFIVFKNREQTRRPFSFFVLFSNKYSTKFYYKSLDSVLEIRTLDNWMVGTDDSIELWQPPCFFAWQDFNSQTITDSWLPFSIIVYYFIIYYHYCFSLQFQFDFLFCLPNYKSIFHTVNIGFDLFIRYT